MPCEHTGYIAMHHALAPHPLDFRFAVSKGAVNTIEFHFYSLLRGDLRNARVALSSTPPSTRTEFSIE